MIRRRQRSTLFPYTTLFRSYDVKVEGVSLVLNYRESFAGVVSAGGIDALIKALSDKNRQVGDRKSTRLNSSHRCISYAVFCLKKKKRDRQRVDHAQAVTSMA